MKVVKFIGKMIGFCLLMIAILFGLVILIFNLLHSMFLSLMGAGFFMLFSFYFIMPKLMKNEIEYFNDKENQKRITGEKDNG